MARLRRPVADTLRFLARRPKLTLTYSLSDLATVSLTAAVVAGWTAAAAGGFSVRALISCQATFLSFYVVGSLFAAWAPLAAGALFDLPLRLLMGYAAVNTALLALAWLSPFGIVTNFLLVFTAAAALFVAAKPARQRAPQDSVGLLAIGLCLAATTLWCQDSIRPISFEGDSVTFKPWVDGFYHAVHLRIFGAAQGASTIEDFRMAGVPARLYHYGAYMSPAFIGRAAALRSYATFAGILAPLGVFFTGLGAYALFGSFWGRWPGLAAAAALMLLPDGAQQGLQNKFMSYHWLTQISPSASYGLALLAAAWLFVLLGCTQGSRLQLVAGWLLAGVLAAYKLHFVIASALLLVMVPPLFFAGDLGPRKRFLWAVVAAAAYVVTIVLVQRVPGVPVIRFDFSSLGEIFRLIRSFAERGALRDFLEGHLGPEHSWLSNVILGGVYVLLSVLGIYVPLLVTFLVCLRKRRPTLLVLFPLLLVANFLAMFMGLALDMRSSTPDELSHRPLMIVYFVAVPWMGGAAGLLLLESRRLGRIARPALVGLGVVLLAVPAWLGSGVQQLRAMRLFSPVRVPNGLVRAAEYMRDHGDSRELFQDSQFDRTCVVAAVGERSPYAARTMTVMSYNTDLLQQRLERVDKFTELRDAPAITATAQQLGLRWFLLEPGDQIAWPEEITRKPAFELDGYRLYRF